MKDGSVRNSIEGVVIPPEGRTKSIYNIVFEHHKKQWKQRQQHSA